MLQDICGVPAWLSLLFSAVGGVERKMGSFRKEETCTMLTVHLAHCLKLS
jgi:hypothetical protein